VDSNHQPLVGFNYGYWFSSTGCHGGVYVDANTYDLHCTGQASYPSCECGAIVVIATVHPALRNLEDIALQDDSVHKLYWYHTSRFEKWPDSNAYIAEIAEIFSRVRACCMYDSERAIRDKTSLALHLGTYESAIDNMLRRLTDQDVGDPSTIRYWMHRVQIHLDTSKENPHTLASTTVASSCDCSTFRVGLTGFEPATT
jgi:hypothetical protein